jgi:hypothetical protein
VTTTGRDRKIVLALVPLLVLVGYWFLLLSPKRQEAQKQGDALAKQERQLEDARAQEQRLSGAKSSFATDYPEFVRLGKAVPSTLDMPSLLVQLDNAAHGTGIRFSRIATGDRTEAGSGAAAASSAQSGSSGSPPSGSGSSGSTSSQPASQAGGPKGQTGVGRATEKAHENANATSQRSNASASANPTDTTTSAQSGKGGLPVGGGTATPGQAGSGTSRVAGLDSVPLELTFEGNFFNLADFFHRLKRFVHVFNSQVVVQGRLMTVDGLKFSSDTETFPRLKAELTATAFLSPKAEGATAGASPRGPSSAGGTQPASASASGSSGSGTPTGTASAPNR